VLLRDLLIAGECLARYYAVYMVTSQPPIRSPGSASPLDRSGRPACGWHAGIAQALIDAAVAQVAPASWRAQAPRVFHELTPPPRAWPFSVTWWCCPCRRDYPPACASIFVAGACLRGLRRPRADCCWMLILGWRSTSAGNDCLWDRWRAAGRNMGIVLWVIAYYRVAGCGTGDVRGSARRRGAGST
jgi:hypothetical protein